MLFDGLYFFNNLLFGSGFLCLNNLLRLLGSVFGLFDDLCFSLSLLLVRCFLNVNLSLSTEIIFIKLSLVRYDTFLIFLQPFYVSWSQLGL